MSNRCQVRIWAEMWNAANTPQVPDREAPGAQSGRMPSKIGFPRGPYADKSLLTIDYLSSVATGRQNLMRSW